MKLGKKLGAGTYGAVYELISEDGSKKRIIKINYSDGSGFSHVIRETNMLKIFAGSSSVVSLEAVSIGNPLDKPLPPLSKNDKEEGIGEDTMHFFMEKGIGNLESWMNKNYPNFSQIKMFIMDLLLGVEFINKSRVLHRDLKPNNLVVFPKSIDKLASIENLEKLTDDPKLGVIKPANSKCFNELLRIKIIDFGLAKAKCEDESYTPDVTTFWYRAPESMCLTSDKSLVNYDGKIDAWSSGCIIYEIMAGIPFIGDKIKENNSVLVDHLIDKPYYKISDDEFKRILKRKSRSNQIIPIKKRIEKNFNEIIIRSNNPSLGESRKIKRNMFTKEEKNLILNQVSEIIQKLLIIDPEKRYSVSDALDHEFFDTHREYIERYRKVNIPRVPQEYEYRCLRCKEREWAMIHVFSICKAQEDHDWFSYLRIFHTIDMFDRVLRFISVNPKEVESFDKELSKIDKKFGDNPKGKYISKKLTILYFYVCLFISIKNFSSLHRIIEIKEFIPDSIYSKKNINVMKKMESQVLVDIFSYSVFRHTIYEEINRQSVGSGINKNKKIEMYKEAIKILISKSEVSVNGSRPSKFAKKLIKNATD